jgi:hypothetical protein
MGFFEQLPPPEPAEPEPEQPPRPRWAKPELVLGGTIAEEMILAQGSDAVLAVSGLVAFPNGFCFTVTAVLQRDDRRGRLFQTAFHPEFFDDELPGPEFLRIGVQFADGSAATNLGRFRPLPDTEPAGPLLHQDGGGGGGRRYDMTYWVWPLPPPGPLSVVCEWPAHGIAESRAELDGQLIREAATLA